MKLKFKKEEKQNRLLVDKCLKEGSQFNLALCTFSDGEDENQEQAKPKQRLKKKKKRVRKVRKLELELK